MPGQIPDRKWTFANVWHNLAEGGGEEKTN